MSLSSCSGIIPLFCYQFIHLYRLAACSTFISLFPEYVTFVSMYVLRFMAIWWCQISFRHLLHLHVHMLLGNHVFCSKCLSFVCDCVCVHAFTVSALPHQVTLIILCYPWKSAKASGRSRNWHCSVCTLYNKMLEMHFDVSQIYLPHLYDIEKKVSCVKISMMPNSSRLLNSMSALLCFLSLLSLYSGTKWASS